MLVGKSADGRVVNLLNHTKDEAELLRIQNFYCPSCGSLLILKNGAVMRPHFAHKHSMDCSSFSEGETEEHLRGKSLIAEWCEGWAIDYELEAYLPNLQQRPDVLLEGRRAIEFQCSPLPLARMQERTENYQRHGYQVFWLLGSRFFLKNKMTGFQRLFLNRNTKLGLFLWELDVAQSSLRLSYHIEQLSFLPEVYHSQKSWRKNNGSLLEILSYPEKAKLFLQRHYELLPLYEKQKSIIQKNLIAKNPLFMKTQEQLYMLGTNFSLLHPIFFLPPVSFGLENGGVLYWRVKCWLCLSDCQTINYKKLVSQLLAEKNSMYGVDHQIVQEEWEEMIYTWLKVLAAFNYISIKNGCIRCLKMLDINSDEESQSTFIEKMMRNKTYISRLPKQI